jgi:hypothetical protein
MLAWNMSFPEDFFHYLWKFSLFNKQNYLTVSGDKLEIISVGLHNLNAGPDFESAQLRIGDTLWAGNVEIHIRSSDWNRHQHQFDPAYENVILHVVSVYDQAIYRRDGTEIPVFEVRNLIPHEIAQNYSSLMAELSWIPCENYLTNLEPFILKNWLSRMLIERLEEKSIQVNELLNEYKGSWDDAFYIMLARNFGFKTNALPFEMLARSLPRQILAKYKDRPTQIEALIFGQAGFLNEMFKEPYPNNLMQEYRFLKKKHGLKSIDKYLWKYMRLRPRNFPSLRLAQFAALILKSNHLFSKIKDENRIDDVINLFKDLPINPYWNTHYRFGKECRPASSTFGDEAINNLLINTVAIFSFAFGLLNDDKAQINKGVNLLEKIDSEDNGLIKRFKEMNWIPENAAQSQALIQLKKTYCDQKKCLSCGIGIKILLKNNASTVSNIF